MSARLATLALLAAVAVGGGCRPDESPPVATEVLREGVDWVMIDMDTNLTREGIRRAYLRADTAEWVTEGEIHMHPVELTFFDVDGREASVITADFGIFYENTEDMEASGSIVVLDRTEDRRLETEALRYVSAEDRLYGDRPFTLWEDGGRTELHGAAFESDPGLDSVRVRSPSGQSEQQAPAGPPPAADTAGAPGTGRPTPTAPDTLESMTDTAGALDTAAVSADTTVPVDTTAVPVDTTAFVRDIARFADPGAQSAHPPASPGRGRRGFP